MLKIKTYVDKSQIHGFGVFAKEFVPKGTIVWEYHPLFTVKVSKEDLKSLSEDELLHLKEESYYWVDGDGNYMIPLDHDRFTNHCSIPNIEILTPECSIASRDIHPGEELTNDYKKIYPELEWKDYYLK